MAMQQNAVGILFDVKGGGDISGASGKAIRASIASIVDSLGKDDATKIKFTIDIDEFKKQMSEMTESVTKTTDKLKKDIDKIISSTSGGGGKKSNNNGVVNSEAYKNAIKNVKEYHQWLLKVQKAMTRTNDITLEFEEVNEDQTDAYKIKTLKVSDQSEWAPLIRRMEEAKTKYDEATRAADQFSDEQINAFNAAKQTIETQHEISKNAADASGAESWAKLSVNINKYIQDVEYAASRSPEMAEKLAKLKELADSGDMSNYDEVRNMWRGIQQEINSAGLSVETFGQKIAKHLGETLRNAVAAFISAKIGQYIKGIYDNVVKLDEAIVNLQIATGKNREEVTALVKEYSKLGRQLGATTKEIAAAADTWLRQGLSESDAEEMIKNTTMLSKLGQMESEEAAKALTSAMKGYNIAVEDTISIVDKWTAVDMEAAANAGDLATAMSETATSAGLAGVEMDTLIGYIATVKEVTQDGAESVGTFFRTLFARMNNVAAGNFVDQETGEALNDVEKVLGELGIKLRDVNGIFRESSDVLDEVASKWNTYDNVQRHAIATAFAGTRQQEKFIVLMENYGDAAKYAGIAADSAGIATEKFGAHTEGIQGKVAALTAAYEGLSMSILDSGLITGLVEMVTRFVDFLSIGDAVPAKIALCIAAVVALVGATQALTTATVRLSAAMNAPTTGLLTYIKHVWSLVASQGAAKVATDEHTKSLVNNYTTGVSGILTFIPRAIAAIGMWISSLIKARAATDTTTAASITLKGALDALNVNPIMLAITAAIAVCALLVKAVKSVSEARERAVQAARDEAKAQSELIDAYDEEIDSLNLLHEKLEDARGDRKKLADLYAELNSKIGVSTDLLRGEEAAYHAASAALKDRIKLLEQYREAALSTKVAQNRSAFNDNQVKGFSGDKMRSFARNYGGHDGELFNPETREQKAKDLFIDLKQWDEYWKEQTEIAMDVFDDIVNGSSGVFGNSKFLESAIDKFVRDGYELDEIKQLLIGLTQTDSLDAMLEEYYEVATKDVNQAHVILNNIYTSLDEYANKYPSLAEDILFVVSSITSPEEIYDSVSSKMSNATEIEQESFLQTIKEFGDKYQVLQSALEDVTEHGKISPDTLTDIIDPAGEYKDLEPYLNKTAEGYAITAQSISRFISKQESKYLSSIVKASLEGDEERQRAEAALEGFYRGMQTLGVEIGNIDLTAYTYDAYLNDITNGNASLISAMYGTEGAMERYNSFLQKYRNQFESSSSNVVDPLVLTDLLSGIQNQKDLIDSALKDMSETGVISNDTLLKIFDPESNNQIVKDYLTQTDRGWQITGDAFERIMRNRREELVKEVELQREAAAGLNYIPTSLRQAIDNLELFDSAYGTVTASIIEQPSHPFVQIYEEIEGPYNALKDAVDEWTEDELLSADTVAKILGDFPELQEYIEKQMDGTWTVVDGAMDEFIARLRAKIWATGDKNQLTWFDSVIKTLGIDSENVQDKIDTYLEVYDDVAGPLKALQSAASEFNETGFVSHDTVADILDPDGGFPELAQYLEETADGYKYNVDAIERFLMSKREEYDAVILSNEVGSEAREAAKQNKRWLEMVIETIRRESGEYKSFADILADVANKYSAVSSAIEDMEKYGKLSKGSLSAILNDEDLKAYLTLNKDGSYSFDIDAFDKWAATEEQRLRDLRDSYMEGTDAYIEADNKLQEHIAAVTAAKVSVQNEEEHPFVKMLNSIREPYELLVKAAKEMEEGGLTPDTLAKIFVDFPELEKYLETSIDGTKSLTEGALTQFVTDMRNTITDQDDLNLFDYIVRMLGIENAEDVEKATHPFVKMLEEVGDPYELLVEAAKQTKEKGFVSPDTLAKIFGDFPELEQYLETNLDGTKSLAKDAIDRFVEDMRQIVSETNPDGLDLFDEIITLLGLENKEDPEEVIHPFVEMLNKVEGPYKALKTIANEIANGEVPTADMWATIFGEYPELEKYVEVGADGARTLIEGAIDQLRQDMLDNITDPAAKELFNEIFDMLELEHAEDTEEVVHPFLKMLKEIEGPYKALIAAAEDMADDNIISDGSIIEKLLGEYPDLQNYVKMTEDGWKLAENALDNFIASMRQKIEESGGDVTVFDAVIKMLGIENAKEPEEVIDTFSEMLEHIRGPYETLKTAMDEMAEKSFLTSDTVDKLLGDFPELADYIERGADGLYRVVEGEADVLQRWIEEKRKEFAGTEMEPLFESVIKMLGLENAGEPEEVVDTFSEMLEYIRGPYDALKTAMDEMAGDGILTTDTIDKLLGDFPELEAYVERGADGLYRLVQGETDALQRWIENKRKEFTSDEQRSLFDDIIRLLGLEGEEEPEFVNPLSVILEEVESSYDLLRSAKEDMEEYGVISESTLSSLASLAEEDYEALKNYFTLTADGYTVCEDALEQYVEAKKKEYMAVLASAEVGSDAYNEAYKNLANLLAVFMTLSLSDQIEEATEALEDQTEALEDQREVLEAEQDAWEDRRDAYRDIIDYRKELLQTFKEELDYQRELEQRQRAVADLQTRLSVARLDRSAAGRAKVRELEDELASAEEELNDFTLEHAIEQITNQMDREADEYNRFIDSKIAEIDSAIADVETEIENVRTAIENVSRNIRAGAGDITAQINALLREYGITPPSPSPEVYHSGGFVGGVATLKSNEEFAKLMVGEHVSTPAQIQRFMNETLPGIASNSSRNEFNAPLISIECESVTTEALPGLKQIVNEAVREVKKQLDDGFSRTGYKKPVMRPI